MKKTRECCHISSILTVSVIQRFGRRSVSGSSHVHMRALTKCRNRWVVRVSGNSRGINHRIARKRLTCLVNGVSLGAACLSQN